VFQERKKGRPGEKKLYASFILNIYFLVKVCQLIKK